MGVSNSPLLPDRIQATGMNLGCNKAPGQDPGLVAVVGWAAGINTAISHLPATNTYAGQDCVPENSTEGPRHVFLALQEPCRLADTAPWVGYDP